MKVSLKIGEIMSYFPKAGSNWKSFSTSNSKIDVLSLKRDIELADTYESQWPYDLTAAGSVPGLTDIEEPPHNQALGPYTPRGHNNGCILKGGRVVFHWGEVDRMDMTFSIAKSYLALLTGLAIEDGLISDIDALVGNTVKSGEFDSMQNRSITWRHLLEQTSEWEGTLWGKPDLIDRNRQLGPNADNSRKGLYRKLQTPGSFYEYNDVRVNLLALSLLYTFRRPLPEVLKERVMDPIGASEHWIWEGYHNSFVEIDGRTVQSVPGGTHWGGGIQISTMDHARVALLVHNRGVWSDKRILPEKWCVNLRTPSKLNPNYGLLWWINTRQSQWPGCSEASYGAIGAGTNIIWIDPDDDLIVVARWINEKKVAQLLSTIVQAQK